MSLTFELSSTEEVRLRDEAQRRGVQPEDLARQLFSQVSALALETRSRTIEEMTEERRDWDRLTRP